MPYVVVKRVPEFGSAEFMRGRSGGPLVLSRLEDAENLRADLEEGNRKMREISANVRKAEYEVREVAEAP